MEDMDQIIAIFRNAQSKLSVPYVRPPTKIRPPAPACIYSSIPTVVNMSVQYLSR
jgi:hypothetical protein